MGLKIQLFLISNWQNRKLRNALSNKMDFLKASPARPSQLLSALPYEMILNTTHFHLIFSTISLILGLVIRLSFANEMWVAV